MSEKIWRHGIFDGCMEPDDDGAWVMYRAHLAELARVRREALEEAARECARFANMEIAAEAIRALIDKPGDGK